LSHPENGGDEAWLGNRHTRVKGLTFTMLDRCVMLIVAGYLALFLQAIQGKFSTISSDFGGREASYSLWLVLVGLFIAAVGVLGWLRRPFKRSERIIFFIIFLTVSGCVLIASSGLMLVILRPLFVFASLTALILLILGLLLATWVEEDVYRTRA